MVAAIPAYNEEKTIARVVLEAQRYVDRVFVCDDGSRDFTGDIAERVGADLVRHACMHAKTVVWLICATWEATG